MNKTETIARLETLLARVRTRAGEPRRAAAAAAAPAHVPAPAPAAAPAPAPAMAAPPPPAPPPRPPVASEPELALDVDVQDITTAEVVVAEEPPVPDAFESRERLVAAEPVTEIAAAPEPPLPAEPIPVEELAAEDDVQEAPASSRRPVAPEPEERLAELAFGAEEPRPPRHTPPPESGRLPAAPEVEFDGDITGVREASSAPAPVRPRELAPEATHAHLAPSDAVADMVGDAPDFAPQTFVALLDASLSL